MKEEHIFKEQLRQIEMHKWLLSEKAGYDLKEEARLDWVDHHASEFRKWVNKVPGHCVECGKCCLSKGKPKECPFPFAPERIKKLGL